MACHRFLGFYERSRKGGGNLKRVEQLPSNFSLKDEASSSSGPFFIPSVGAGWEGRENCPRNMVGDEDDT